MSDPYYIKIVMQAGNGERIYQRTTFEQFYDDSAQQITEQDMTFPAVAETVIGAMKKASEAYLASKK